MVNWVYGKLFQIATAYEEKENEWEFLQIMGCRSVRGCVYLTK